MTENEAVEATGDEIKELTEVMRASLAKRLEPVLNLDDLAQDILEAGYRTIDDRNARIKELEEIITTIKALAGERIDNSDTYTTTGKTLIRCPTCRDVPSSAVCFECEGSGRVYR